MPRRRASAGEPGASATLVEEQAQLPLGLAALSPDTKFRLLRAAVEKQAIEARQSAAKFFEFAVREEFTRSRLVTQAHQWLMFDFVEHYHRCVLREPRGTGKTELVMALSLIHLGRDPTTRGVVLSKAGEQASKVVGRVKAHIEEPILNAPVKLVYPHLQRGKGAWSDKAIIVQRTAGIRDPSLIALGLESQKILGSRWSWMVCDDLLDFENTMTPGGREKVYSQFKMLALGAVDPAGRIVVTNTPYHPQDLTYTLEQEEEWPTLTMDIYGFIRFSNVDPGWIAACPHVRPSLTRPGTYRLTAHDPDPRDLVPLWPDKFPVAVIEGELRARNPNPNDFARLFLCEPYSGEGGRCHRSWLEKCKQRGAGLTLVDRYEGPNRTFTACDLALGKHAHKGDLTSFVTCELLPDGSRRLLMIESGRWQGPEIVRRAIDHADRYGSILGVETVQAQLYIQQFIEDKRRDITVRCHDTDQSNKADFDFGIESLFTEFQREAWIIPSDARGNVHPEVRAWIEEILRYQPPPAHPGDRLIASWICRELMRRGFSRGGDRASLGQQRTMFSQRHIAGF
jgi:hypothetical protein